MNLNTDQKSHLITLTIFLAVWLNTTLDLLLMPSLSGYDSVTRLYHAERLLVDMVGNVWLPFLQFFIRTINLFTSNLFAFKIFNFIVATLGMIITYLVIYRYFGKIIAIAAISYFLIHLQWIGAATSIYMEPIFLLNLTLACLFYHHKKTLLAGLFFIFATFSRPELLLASPAIVGLFFFYSKNYLKTLILSALYLPIVLFYLWMKYNINEFSPPTKFSLEISIELLASIFDVYLYSKLFLLEGILALAGAMLLFANKIELKNARLLKFIFLGLIIYVVLYTLVIPFFHDFAGGGGGTRKSMYIVMPSFIYAGIFCLYLHQKYPKQALLLFGVFLALLASAGYNNRDLRTFWPYHIASEINGKLTKKYSPTRTHYLCKLTPTTKEIRRFQSIVSDQVEFYLKQQGWKLEKINCEIENQVFWMKLAKDRKAFLLRIYDYYIVDKNLSTLLGTNCKTGNIIRINGRARGRYCF